MLEYALFWCGSASRRSKLGRLFRRTSSHCSALPAPSSPVRQGSLPDAGSDMTAENITAIIKAAGGKVDACASSACSAQT